MRLLVLFLILFVTSRCSTLEDVDPCREFSDAVSRLECEKQYVHRPSIEPILPSSSLGLNVKEQDCQTVGGDPFPLKSGCTYINSLRVRFKCAANIAGNDYPIDLRGKKVLWKLGKQSGNFTTNEKGVGAFVLVDKRDQVSQEKSVMFSYNKWNQEIRMALLFRPVVIPIQYCSN